MSAAPSPGLFTRLRGFLFYRVPAEHRTEFARELTFANYDRAGFFLFLIGFLCLAVLVPFDLFRWRPEGYWVQNPAFVSWYHLHLFIIVFAVVYGALLYVNRPVSPAETQRRHRWLVQGFLLVTFATTIAASLLTQRITGNVIVYILAVTTYAAAFYTKPGESAALLGLSFAVFAGLVPLFQPDEVRAVTDITGVLDFIVCFWVVSRIIYSLKARDFASLRTIAQQSERLAAANLNFATVNRELIEANRLKAQLIEIAAHDLRDPLHTIGGLAQTLREETMRQQQLLPWVEGIAQSSRRMLGLVENLLTDAESDTGRISLQKEPADLRALVESVLAGHAPLAAAKNLRIQFATGTRPAQLARVDPVRCRQIVENLVSNAIKYSPAGKSIWITLEPDVAGDHRLSVRDEGPGLTPADQAQLFTRFQRLSARPTGGETSTGLGLAITKNLVGLHGGRIWAESPGPGQGTNFIVVLP